MMNGSGTPSGASSSEAVVASPIATAVTPRHARQDLPWDSPGSPGSSGVGGSAAGQSLADLPSVPNAMLLEALLVAVFLLVYLRPDRIRIAYALLPIGAIGLAFASGSLLSIGRQVMVAFPNGWLLAGRRARWLRIAWPIISMVLLGVISALTFAGWFGP